MKELFNRFMKLKFDIQNLAEIVQNEGVAITKDEMREWNEIANRFQSNVDELINDVNSIYKYKINNI